MTDILEAWAVEPDCVLEDAVAWAASGVARPTFSGLLLSTRPRSITVQVVEGAPHPAGQLYFVPHRGVFRLVRVEAWSPLGRRSLRFLVTLGHTG